MKYLSLLLLLFVFSTVEAQKAKNTSICQGDSCIVVLGSDDATLKRILRTKPRLDHPEVFNPQSEKAFGFGTAEGISTIPFQFDDASAFFHGYAVITLKDLQGIIDSTGKMVVPLKYKGLSDMSEGLALFSLKGEKVDGIVDLNGKETLLDPAVGTVDAKLNLNGTMITSIRIDNSRLVYNIHAKIPYVFSEGAVVLGNRVMDKKGKLLFFTTHTLDDCHDGMFRISKKLSTGETWYGFTSKKGVVVIQPIYRAAENFSNGRALVTSGSPLKPIRKYIDKTGKVVETLK